MRRVSRSVVAAAVTGLTLTQGLALSQPPACKTDHIQCPPLKVIVHMQQPEVVVEPPETCADPQERKCGLFKRLRRHAPRGPAAAPTVASILVPAPAMVPAAPAVPFAAAPCSPGAAGGDLPALRAAQEAELALARLAAAAAAHEAQARSFGASIDRIRAAVPQLFPPARPGAPEPIPAPGAKSPSLDASLANTVTDLAKRVSALEQLIRIHNDVLRRNFPKELKE
jgi:hypothetical protein